MTLSGPEDRAGKHQELHRNLSWHRDNITKLQEVALLSQDRAVHGRNNCMKENLRVTRKGI